MFGISSGPSPTGRTSSSASTTQQEPKQRQEFGLERHPQGASEMAWNDIHERQEFGLERHPSTRHVSCCRMSVQELLS
jgi:hypothetical protein